MKRAVAIWSAAVSVTIVALFSAASDAQYIDQAPVMGNTNWVADGDCYIKKLSFIDTFKGKPINAVLLDDDVFPLFYTSMTNPDGSHDLSIEDIKEGRYAGQVIFGHHSPQQSAIFLSWQRKYDDGTVHSESCKYLLK